MAATAIATSSHLVPEIEETNAAVDNTVAATDPRFNSRRGAVGPAGMLNSGARLPEKASLSGVRMPARVRRAIAIDEAAISVKPKTAIEIARANAEYVLSVSN
jgi:hypothetical protein